MFENLQIFNKDLENSDSDRGVILKKIAPLKFQLKENNNKTAPQNNVQFIDLYNNIEDKMLTFTETYKSLKNTIYNYINAILVV